jgi:hypothetical protein
LNHSTPELERYFSRPLSELPRQNPYPVAVLLPLFLVAFALNLLPFLQHVAGVVTFTSCIELFLTIIDDDRRAHCDKRTSGSREDVGIAGVYGVVHHSADNDPRSGYISCFLMTEAFGHGHRIFACYFVGW